MRVLSVASEAYPLVKTGGLADVVGALPAALLPHGIEMTTLLPGYPSVVKSLGRAKVARRWDDLLGVPARLLTGQIDGHPLLVLDAPELFARDGGPYGDATGRDWDDNWRRFAALGRAAADLATQFDLVHAHDWQGAMAPAYLRYDDAQVPSILTIHNIAFQGRYDAAVFAGLALPDSAFALDGIEYYGGVGLLKAGLASADAITTVSPSYAEEIRRAEFGMGLEGLIEARRDRVSGIVNGIDPAVWSPESDSALPARYTARTLPRRRTNKRAVEQAFGIETGDGPIFVVVSRLTWQKGMDVLAGELDALVAMGGRLALLGSGDAALEQAFVAAASRHAGRIGVRIGYDEGLSHLLQGGGDAILIPSRFEPCGLTQLYGLAYGCVPVVARTGGLADTVIDANEAAVAAGVATGVQFDAVTPAGLSQALRRTMALYARPDCWTTIQKQGMRADFSWTRSGARYAGLYRSLLAA
ncbi:MULTISPECIES: glycogen synthase GlgA [unclassified Sphingomonas]|uniref:glycogen synthase GlgA n=1 Tax=unclassified Sphingomonas TaxID=196159 RepID=UPI0006F54997|nr:MULTISPECIES: glycogen synthase GlgA [unclassified Sphingomonas]KQM66861.1 glycogen synthase [Sphingomonas sp. Leaf16]KQN17809.1 glycogen synthase [Sphingomonas sp. Leaf29]KQN23672.1 glycogen synthase [Sphingomonas sp. Leaf32]